MNHSSTGRFAGLPLPAWLIALSIVPLLGGVASRLQIIAATFYCLVGALQFDSGLRRRWCPLHRVLGRLTVACGLVAGLTGLWMTRASEIPSGL